MQETAFSFFNPTKIYQFKAKKSEKKYIHWAQEKKTFKKILQSQHEKKIIVILLLLIILPIFINV